MHDASLGTARTLTPGARHRPLVPVLAGLCVGIVLDASLKPPAGAWLAAGSVAVPLTWWAARRNLEDWGRWLLAAVLLIWFGGYWHATRFREQPVWHLSNLRPSGGELHWVRGEIVEEPRLHLRARPFEPAAGSEEGYWSVRLRARGISGDRADWRPLAGGIRVFVNEGQPHLAVGDEVELLAALRANRQPTNPGERDTALAYARAGTHATASVPSPEALRVLARGSWRRSPAAAVSRARAWVRQEVQEFAPKRASGSDAGLVVALICGQTDLLTPDQDALLRESGTLHFLAVSGMHVALFWFFVEGLLVLAGAPVRLRAVLGIGLVWAYVLFTGASVSAARAGWMLTFVLAAPIVGRRKDSLSALAGAALLILLASPQQLFSAGFQLTFVAVWALIVVYPQLAGILWPWEDLVARLQRPEERTVLRDMWLLARSYVALSFVAWLATAPILAYHFNTFTPLTPVLTVLLWPVVLSLMVASFVSVPLLVVGGVCAKVLLLVPLGLSRLIESLLQVSSALPGFGRYVAAPPVWWVGLCYLGLGAWAVRQRLPRGRAVFLASVALLASTYLALAVSARLNRAFTVVVADVGEGQAVLFGLPEGQAVVVDAGSSRQSAERPFAELLWHERVGRIDALALSHFDGDHCSFLPYLSRRFRVGCVALPLCGVIPPFASQVYGWLDAQGLRVRRLSEGARLVGGGLDCQVLHPDERFAGSPGVLENDKSAVLMCRYQGLSVLLPGDVQTAGIRRLVRTYGNRLRADVLLMPHHGHFGPGLDELVDCVRPSAVLVSGQGADLAPATSALLAARQLTPWITGTDGAIIVSLRDGLAEVRGFRSGRSVRIPLGQAEGGGYARPDATQSAR